MSKPKGTSRSQMVLGAEPRMGVTGASDDRHGQAAEVAACLAPGCRMIGISCGGFWMIDLVVALLAHTGPADVDVTSYAIGAQDAATLAGLRADGRVLRLRGLFDRAMVSFGAEGAKRQREQRALVAAGVFGVENVRFSGIHCKIVTIRNDAWNLALRGSANMNGNPRWEQWDLDDSEQIADFYGAAIDHAFATTTQVDGREAAEAAPSAAKLLGELAGKEAKAWGTQKHPAPRDLAAADAPVEVLSSLCTVARLERQVDAAWATHQRLLAAGNLVSALQWSGHAADLGRELDQARADAARPSLSGGRW